MDYNQDMEKQKSGNRRISKKSRRAAAVIVAGLVLAVCAGSIILRMHTQRASFALIGDREMTINLGETFQDPGASGGEYKTKGGVDTSKPGMYTIVYSKYGRDLTRKVHVVDPDRIILGLKGSPVQLVKQGDPYIENGAFATDKEEGPLDESLISISGDVDTSSPGDYEVVYTVSENDGLSTRTRTVRVLKAKDYGQAADSVPVMMYHWVYSADDVPTPLDGNWILDTELESQLKYLHDNGYYYPGWKELRAWIDGEISLPDKSIVVTFDDGTKMFLKHGVPLLEKYEVPATSFMICWNDNGAKKKVRKNASPYIDYESHSFAMHQQGTVSGYRGIIAAMSKDEILDDLKQAQKVIKNNDAFAYPYGDWTFTAVEALNEQGILCSFTTDYGKVTQGMDPQRLPRVRVLGDAGFDRWRMSIG